MTNAFQELEWRGLIYDHIDGVADLLANEPVTVYIGFDPTGPSLHVGHLVPLMALARMQRFGHTPIAIAGAGTAMIGDPGGKDVERPLLSSEEIEANLVGIRQQMAAILDFEAASNPAQILNNADWLLPMPLMTFLRDVGKHFTVNYMMAKDSVKSRLDREGSGISFTEFSYMLLQAYDYLVLHERFGCRLQAGGSDQWGNITAGVELIRRVKGEKVYAMCYPLITKADGTKFGKTAGGSVWLDPQLTSPYRFYQFWLNTDDAEVVNYLKYFTFLSRPEVAALESALFERPEKREAQRRLAREMTQMVHGETALAQAEQASSVLFGGSLDGLDAAAIGDIFADVPSTELPPDRLENGDVTLVDLLCETGLASSKGDARRSIEGGGIYLNNERIGDTAATVDRSSSIDGQFFILRKGRKKYHLIRLPA